MAYDQAGSGMTRAELLQLPASIDLETGARALGVGRTKAHMLVRQGEWPTRVLRLGRSYRVVTADVLALLGIAVPEDASESTPHARTA